MKSSAANTPWILGDLTIGMAAVATIERCAEAAYARGEEACGFFAGPAGVPLLVDTATELENLANKYHAVDPEGHPRNGREYFKINSREFERALEAAIEAGRPVKGIFHSHLDCDAYFSEEDAVSMTLGDGSSPPYPLTYLVTAVERGRVRRHVLFVWDPSSCGFVESHFAIADP